MKRSPYGQKGEHQSVKLSLTHKHVARQTHKYHNPPKVGCACCFADVQNTPRMRQEAQVPPANAGGLVAGASGVSSLVPGYRCQPDRNQAAYRTLFCGSPQLLAGLVRIVGGCCSLIYLSACPATWRLCNNQSRRLLSPTCDLSSILLIVQETTGKPASLRAPVFA